MDSDDDLHDEDPEDEICGYYCLCCGNIQDDPSQCEVCNAIALDPIYF